MSVRQYRHPPDASHSKVLLQCHGQKTRENRASRPNCCGAHHIRRRHLSYCPSGACSPSPQHSPAATQRAARGARYRERARRFLASGKNFPHAGCAAGPNRIMILAANLGWGVLHRGFGGGSCSPCAAPTGIPKTNLQASRAHAPLGWIGPHCCRAHRV